MQEAGDPRLLLQRPLAKSAYAWAQAADEDILVAKIEGDARARLRTEVTRLVGGTGRLDGTKANTTVRPGPPRVVGESGRFDQETE